MHLRPLRRLLAAVVAAGAVALVPALPAHAASGTGWVRLAHLSPDTRAVDVRIAPLDDGGAVKRLDGVAYGAVSSYLALPAGEYAVAMRPAGADDSATPVIQASMTVTAGDAMTVGVFGLNKDLHVKVIPDLLKSPTPGDARVRVVQAATGGDPVTLTATDSDEKTLVANASLGSVSAYSDVAAGSWRLAALQGGKTSSSTVVLKAGQIASMFVLEKSDGGLVVKSVLDSSSAGALPKGYLATGGGFIAHEQQQDAQTGLVAVGAIAAVGVAAGAVALRRRRAHA